MSGIMDHALDDLAKTLAKAKGIVDHLEPTDLIRLKDEMIEFRIYPDPDDGFISIATASTDALGVAREPIKTRLDFPTKDLKIPGHRAWIRARLVHDLTARVVELIFTRRLP